MQGFSSIHFPHPREDRTVGVLFLCVKFLQSTSLIRGKTLLLIPLSESAHLQSTSLIRGKTAFIGGEYAETISSIHFPHPREDQQNICSKFPVNFFNPLPSSEGRLTGIARSPSRADSSIHFPHPREDLHFRQYCYTAGLFNPLPSSEGRPPTLSPYRTTGSLQSTSLIRGKTPRRRGRTCSKNLQSTSLIRGKTTDVEIQR